MAGIVFAKLARPKARAHTVMFSKNAVITMRNGQFWLMFRLGNMRKSHLIESHIRAQMIYHKKVWFIFIVERFSFCFLIQCMCICIFWHKPNLTRTWQPFVGMAFFGASFSGGGGFLRHSENIYRKRAIITRGLYTYFKPTVKVKNIFSRRFFQKIMPLCMVSVQERVMMAHVR